MATHLQQKGIQTEYELIKGPVIETIIAKASFLKEPDVLPDESRKIRET